MNDDLTRRRFLSRSLGLASAAVLPELISQSATPPTEDAARSTQDVPWYRRALRWGQTNITEKDALRYDLAWWREYWKRTETQGVIVNAGGIFAYYPSKFPLHYRAQFLGDRDLFGEIADAAHRDGLVVFARMDSNRASAEALKAHPEWFARDLNGQPYRAEDRYVTCIFSAYYDEYLPEVLREIISRSKPEGFTDNSWAGLGRNSICYCANCEKRFAARTGKAIPRRRDWDDPVYRQWIQWNYARRVEVWDQNNRVTQEAGGKDCIWAGMNSGSVSSQASSFRDMRQITQHAAIVMLDHQARSDSGSFQQNSDTGRLVAGVAGSGKLLVESMAMYQAGRNVFRASAKPAAEARQWMLAGMAGGIQPWWHHVGAYQEDRRAYATAEPVMKWHKANEAFLVNRRPVANVGVVWSQTNTDFYGRDEAGTLVDQPYDGLVQALVRARIPYVPVHIDAIESAAPAGATGPLSVVIMPGIGAMSDAQCTAVRRFVQAGGSLLATGAASLYDEWGDARPDFGLADVFGAHCDGTQMAAAEKRAAAGNAHSYLRLSPELRARVPGPKIGDEPAPTGQRHPVLRGFDDTDILAFGGQLAGLRAVSGATVPLTFIPPYPAFPPETAWMREPKTSVPGLILQEAASVSTAWRDNEPRTLVRRIAFLPADIDRRYARNSLPDHGNLLANLVRWAAKDELPFSVEGPGLLNCTLYAQLGRLVLHLVNLTSTAAWRAPMEEVIPVGPIRVRVRLLPGVAGRSVELRVAGGKRTAAVSGGWAAFDIPSIGAHEMAVIT